MSILGTIAAVASVGRAVGLVGGGDGRLPKPRRGFGGARRALAAELGLPTLRGMVRSGALRGRLTAAQAASIGHPELAMTPSATAPAGLSALPLAGAAVPFEPPWGTPMAMPSWALKEARKFGGGAAAGLAAAGTRAVAGRIAARLPVGPTTSGGEEVGVIGPNVPSPPGYPVGPSLEDMREQTIAPDLWVRRVTAGVAVPAGRIKRGYQVPLVDADGDIEGWVRADVAIPARSIILYPHGATTVTPEIILGGVRRPRVIGHVTVSDFEGIPDYLGPGTVFAPPKRRRGGIHITAKELTAARKAAKKLERLAKAHTKASILPRRRRR